MSTDERKSAGGTQQSAPLTPADLSGLPVAKDVAVQFSIDEHGKPVVESVKPVFRPPELKSRPIKPHWAYVWAVIVVLVILAWIFLFSYFSVHQAPYSAPVR